MLGIREVDNSTPVPGDIIERERPVRSEGVPKRALPPKLGDIAGSNFKSPLVSLQFSCASQPTNGLIASALRLARNSCGKAVAVIRDAAIGAIVLTWMFLDRPSSASAFASPNIPSLAAA